MENWVAGTIHQDEAGILEEDNGPGQYKEQVGVSDSDPKF